MVLSSCGEARWRPRLLSFKGMRARLDAQISGARCCLTGKEGARWLTLCKPCFLSHVWHPCTRQAERAHVTCTQCEPWGLCPQQALMGRNTAPACVLTLHAGGDSKLSSVRRKVLTVREMYERELLGHLGGGGLNSRP